MEHRDGPSGEKMEGFRHSDGHVEAQAESRRPATYPAERGLPPVVFTSGCRDGALRVADADEYGLCRVSLSDTGEHRYRELVRSQPTSLRVSAPEGPTGGGTGAENDAGAGAEPGAGQRRGWCVAGCGCVVDVPPGGAVYVDCPVCAPPAAAGNRPDPAAADGRPVGGGPVRVGRRSEQIVGRERDRIALRLAQRYAAGETLRGLAAETGRSFGWVRTLLLEAGVQLRGRGGDHSGARHSGLGEVGR